MKKIFKYQILNDGITIPEGFTILCIQFQQNSPCLWAEVIPESKPIKLHFEVVATGGEPPENGRYIATVQHNYHVWHFYQLIP